VRIPPHGDLTTEALGIGGLPGLLSFSAREPFVLAGGEEAGRLLGRAGATVRVLRPEGTRVERGEAILKAQGSAAALHLGWKPALHMVEYLSGIATRTRRLVEAARAASSGREVPIAATRKTFPGTRDLALRAIRAGGGIAHRLGLSDSILIFAQHTAFLGASGLGAAIARVRTRQPERKLVVEVCGLDEALAAVHWRADVVQVEKLPPQQFAELVAACRSAADRPLLAATGGIDESNAAAYAQAGADLIVTSAPYSARPVEVQVTLVPC